MKPNLSLSELLGWDGASPLRADLHCHSTISDGSFTSAELLAQAQAAGLTHLAITNHDTTAGFDDAAAAAQALSAVPSNEGSAVITYVSGIEISAWNPVSERKVHILGFGLKENSPAIAALCGPTLRARTENTAWQQEQLEKAGYSLDYELLKKLRAASTGFYKQHLMEYLVATEQVEEMFGTFYHETFKNGGYCDFDIEYLDAAAAVRVITEAGGLAVLAHPGQQQNLELVPELVGYGLKGIELEHRKNTEADKEAIRQMAVQYGLFLTGGSDYHGTLEDGSSELGSCLATENALRIIFNNNSDK